MKKFSIFFNFFPFFFLFFFYFFFNFFNFFSKNFFSKFSKIFQIFNKFICFLWNTQIFDQNKVTKTMKIVNFVKKIINFDVKKKIFRLRRAPSSGISLSGGQVSDGRLRRGLIVAAEHPHDLIYTHITSVWSESDSVLGQR